jgi:hypothetical protein
MRLKIVMIRTNNPTNNMSLEPDKSMAASQDEDMQIADKVKNLIV